jgi:hypothetical protein
LFQDCQTGIETFQLTIQGIVHKVLNGMQDFVMALKINGVDEEQPFKHLT